MNWTKVWMGVFFSFYTFHVSAQVGAATANVTQKRSPLPEAYWLYKQLDSIVGVPENLRWSTEYCTHFDRQMTNGIPQQYVDHCKDEYIQLNDELAIPAIYLQKEPYYAIWDSKNLASYNYDIRNFNDTLPFKLYDEKKDEHWHAPLKNTKINSKYGMRRGRWHHGTDLDVEIGDPVYAAFDGVVRMAKYNRGGYGYYVMIRHKNGMETLYGHLKTYYVQEGTIVKAGDVIGEGGNTGRSTGPHLHFEVRYSGHSINPIHLFDFKKDKLLQQEFILTRAHFDDYIESLKAQYCRVRKGDYLGKIARRYGTTVRRLCKLNGINRRTILRIGRRLRYR